MVRFHSANRMRNRQGAPTQSLRSLWAPFTAVLVLAAVLRFYGLNWDSTELLSQDSASFHRPYVSHVDERGLLNVAMKLNRQQWNPKWFGHGSLPIYLMKLGSAAMQAVAGEEWGDYGHMVLVGRFFSALFGTATVWITFLIGLRAFSPFVAFTGSAFLGLTVLHIQMSHFATVDVPLVFFANVVLLFGYQYFRNGSIWHSIFCGLFAGFAMGCKFSASTLLGFVVAVHLLRAIALRLWNPVSLSIVSVVASVVGFFLAEPYAFLDAKSAWPVIFYRRDMVLGRNMPIFIQQYIHTAPFVYPLQQMIWWCFGPFLAALILTAFSAASIYAIRQVRSFIQNRSTQSYEVLILAVWLVPSFLFTGSLPVKFPRYFLHLYPAWCLLAALLLQECWNRFPSRRILIASAGAFVFITSAVWTAGFMRIYAEAHTNIQATAWCNQNLPAESKILTEHWNEQIPLQNSSGYFRMGVKLPVLDLPDTHSKLQLCARMLESADFLTLPNLNLAATVLRLSHADPKYPNNVYPYMSSFYELLLHDQLGYKVEKSFTKYPGIFGWEWNDDPVDLSDPQYRYRRDQSLTFYDHPKVLILKNQQHLTAQEIERRVIKNLETIPQSGKLKGGALWHSK